MCLNQHQNTLIVTYLANAPIAVVVPHAVGPEVAADKVRDRGKGVAQVLEESKIALIAENLVGRWCKEDQERRKKSWMLRWTIIGIKAKDNHRLAIMALRQPLPREMTTST